MRLHYLQHVPFEDPTHILSWAANRGVLLSKTLLYKDFALPSHADYDFLVIMGGPMNIYEEAVYPWLKQEKEFLRESIRQKKKILGICLGAQLLSDVLGGKVQKNSQKEIGWFPVALTDAGKQSSLFQGFPDHFIAFHWHGDTFALADGVQHLATSEACNNQAFLYRDHVLGLQFHLEASRESIAKLVQNCSSELVIGKFIEKQSDLLEKAAQPNPMREQLEVLLDRFFLEIASVFQDQNKTKAIS